MSWLTFGQIGSGCSTFSFARLEARWSSGGVIRCFCAEGRRRRREERSCQKKCQKCQTQQVFEKKPECVVAPPLLPRPHEGSSQKAVGPVGGQNRACCHSECLRRKRPRDRLRSPGSRGRASPHWSCLACCSSTGDSLVRHLLRCSGWCSCCSCCSRCLAPDPALPASLALSCSHLSCE